MQRNQVTASEIVNVLNDHFRKAQCPVVWKFADTPYGGKFVHYDISFDERELKYWIDHELGVKGKRLTATSDSITYKYTWADVKYSRLVTNALLARDAIPTQSTPSAEEKSSSNKAFKMVAGVALITLGVFALKTGLTAYATHDAIPDFFPPAAP